MKRKLLDILVCPDCKGSLKLKPFSESGNDVGEGILTCRKCEMWYPVINHIPRMIPPSLINKSRFSDFVKRHEMQLPATGDAEWRIEEVKKRTSESFGFQWNVFSEMHKEYEKNFLNYVEPLKPKFFKNKLVLDAGCGFGRHTYYAAKYGSEVVGFDLSDAVDAAYENCKHLPKVHIVQGDIYKLPFRKKFDFIMSIGVLHHLPRPEKGYQSLVDLARPGSMVFAWLYGSEGRAFKTVFLENTIRKVAVKMPKRMLYYFCYLPATLYHVSNVLYRMLSRMGAKSVAERMPFKNYAKFPFRVKLADSYDFLGTPINNYYTREESEQWAINAKLNDISVTSLGGRSWRIFGKKS